jgi:hypothetical protein
MRNALHCATACFDIAYVTVDEIESRIAFKWLEIPPVARGKIIQYPNQRDFPAPKQLFH